MSVSLPKALLCVLLVVVPGCSWAAAPRPLLSEYTHTAWTAVDGAPTGATKFAQGADGWLWIATPTGLFRFDGVHFERVSHVHGHALATSNIMALTTAPDGALWVGDRVGAVSVFRQDGAHTYAENGGLQPVGVMHIEVAPDGAVWAAMRDGVAVLAPGAQRFAYLPPDAGLPALGVFQVLFARDGTTWIGTNAGAYFRPRGETRFRPSWPREGRVALAEAPDGAIWAQDFEHRYYQVRRTAPPGAKAIKPDLDGKSLRYDRQGTQWVLHADALERRIGNAGDGDAGGAGAADQRLSPLNGISGPMLTASFQDREGNLWIGTSQGIDRLRPNRLSTMPGKVRLQFPALLAGPEGDVWVGDYSGDVWRYDADGPRWREVAGQITAAHTAPDGVLWLGGTAGVKRRALDGTVTTFGFPDEVQGLRVQALQQDRHGALWASFSAGKGVYRLEHGRWVKSGGLRGMSELLTTTMTLDAAGDLWLGHLRSQISVVRMAEGDVRTLGAAQGLELGTVLALHPDGQRMWVGGENGVALYRDGRPSSRFVPLQGERGERFRGVSGIVRMADGDLWLHGAEGLYRIAAASLDAWLSNPQTQVAFERFDARDGMQGHAPQLRPVPSLLRARDGKLWYATASSVGTIDPANILRNRLPPPVRIVAVVAEGTRHELRETGSPTLALPQGTRTMQIDFTALSLSIPERVRMRYRLVGLDRDWQEPVGRRAAYYTNLAPGKYRFEVIASNEDNLWNTTGAALDIGIAPTFVQTGWFKLLLAGMAALLLYVAYALRIRSVTRRMHERLHERLAERTRIARALHDTLLQSVQSLLLSFDAHSRLLKEGTQERMRLDQTLNLAELLLVEGRDQIMDLRAAASPEELGLALEQFGKGLTGHRAHQFEMRVRGAPHRLQPGVQDEVYAIAREALFNASRYAEAGKITLALEYAAAGLVLCVEDDGRGLDETVAATGHRPGHWGMVGMRERARNLGGTLDIDSAPGAGTRITLRVPARTAY